MSEKVHINQANTSFVKAKRKKEGMWYQDTKKQNIGMKGEKKIYVEIIEEPLSDGTRFRYKNEKRSSGRIKGAKYSEKNKTFPTVKVHGCSGPAVVVASLLTIDGPPHYPHPHKLAGKSHKGGVCYKQFNNPDMICRFSDFRIECVKRKDVMESLNERKLLQVDPFGTGFSHASDYNKINFNAVRLCFQVFLPNSSGEFVVPVPPVISSPIYDTKIGSDLSIMRLSHYCAPVEGDQEIILLCGQVNKGDIEIVFEEREREKIIWSAFGKFREHDVHRKVAITFKTPPYKDLSIQENVKCLIYLRRPSDNHTGKKRSFTLLPSNPAAKRPKLSLCRPKFDEPDNASFENSGTVSELHQRYNLGEEYKFPTPVLGNEIYDCDQSFNFRDPQNSFPTARDKSVVNSENSRDYVDDVLFAYPARNPLNNAEDFNYMQEEESLHKKLSDLSLIPDSSDLDINISGLTIDSATEIKAIEIAFGSNDDPSAAEPMSIQNSLSSLQDGGAEPFAYDRFDEQHNLELGLNSKHSESNVNGLTLESFSKIFRQGILVDH